MLLAFELKTKRPGVLLPLLTVTSETGGSAARVARLSVLRSHGRG